jgi:AraC family transcriptional regulator of adaptative response/methylated-DNA-[protein]-cysteine methyltransferase
MARLKVPSSKNVSGHAMNMPSKQELAAARVVNDPRWAAVAGRDAAADDTFVYSVRTTGVYCRPSCASRAARPENIAFFASPGDAEAAGFRACKRCRPHAEPPARQQAALVAELCRFIERSEEIPTLATLAAHAGLSAFHLHRLFKSATGLTPRAYAAAHRAERARRRLDTRASVTEAIYGAGYGSNARFYEEVHDRLGMTPSRYRAGGAAMTIRFAIAECSLGLILVARTARGVCAIFMGDDRTALISNLRERFPRAEITGDGGFADLVERVVAFVESPKLALDLPLDVQGTAFQQRVWQALRTIPAGTTVSYRELAQLIGRPQSVRAVAQACAANPVAMAIPCHRVVRSNGDLSGYRWGVARKRALIEREATDPNTSRTRSESV